MSSKKGVIDVQFNWVFILIAGVLILLFFGSVVLKLKSNSETNIANNILTNMQTIMAGAEVSANTVTPMSIPNTEIKVSCDSISAGSITRDITKNKIVFAPELIKGRTMLTWSLSWAFPYHISNFLYITTPDFKYIILDSEKGREIYSMLPTGVNKEITDDVSGLRNTGHKLSFVFFNNPSPDEVQLPSFMSSMKDNEAVAINVDSSSNEIGFYKKSGTSFIPVGKVPYLGNEMIIGAMFSGDAENYACNAGKALEKMNIVSMVYEKRTQILREKYSNTNCVSYYALSPFAVDYNLNNVVEIKNTKESLETNNNFLQSLSCPTMY